MARAALPNDSANNLRALTEQGFRWPDPRKTSGGDQPPPAGDAEARRGGEGDRQVHWLVGRRIAVARVMLDSRPPHGMLPAEELNALVAC